MTQQLVSPELRLAVASLYDGEAAEDWQSLLDSPSLDWSRLSREAVAYDLAPLMFKVIEKYPGDHIPGSTHAIFEEHYYETASFNVLACQELTRILSLLYPLDLPVIVLKGAALLHTIYDSYGLRPMVDLDLLVPFNKIDEAMSVLEANRYTNSQLHPFRNPAGLFWNETLMTNDDGFHLQLELHWHLLDNPYYATRLSTKQLIDNSIVITINDTEARVLAPVDQLIHLCAHNVYHHFGLYHRTMVDIALLIDKYNNQLCWDELIAKSEQYDLHTPVATSLIQAASFWYAPIPGEIIKRLRYSKFNFHQRFFMVSQRSEFLKVFRTWLELPGVRLKLVYLKGQLFPDKEYLQWRYSPGTPTSLPKLYIKRYLSGLYGLWSEVFGP